MKFPIRVVMKYYVLDLLVLWRFVAVVYIDCTEQGRVHQRAVVQVEFTGINSGDEITYRLRRFVERVSIS